MLNIIKSILVVSLISLFTVTVSAQRDSVISREVEVVKSFKPKILDSYKINEMPKIEETEHQKPNFNYNIKSEPVVNAFSVNPLKPASIASTPREETGYGLVRAGFGNYNKPYGEVFFNHLISRKTIFGIHAMHLSSHGDVKLKGDDKVDAPFSKNEAEIYINQFFRKSVLSFNVDFSHDGFNYYGYPEIAVPGLLFEDDQTINLFGSKQAFTKGGLSVKLDNPSIEIDERFFSFDLDYHYFGTKTDQTEHTANFITHTQIPFSFGTGLLDVGASFNMADNVLNRASQIIDTRQQTWLIANPSVYLGGEMFNATLGLKTWYVFDKDLDDQFKIAPNVLLNFMPVKNILKVYAGIDGNFINNHYSKIAYENPFVNPEHDVLNSFEKFRFFGGFDGKFTKKTNFKIGAQYSMIDNQALYYLHEYTHPDPSINPDPQIVDNDFRILYDDLNLLKFNVEVIHRSSDKLDLLLSGNYYIYNLENQTSAWNMPDWDANLSLGYKITERLNVTADFILIGTRKALIQETPPPTSPLANNTILKSYNLDTVFDMNVRGNYKITERFSVFAQLNNFGFQKYERWFGYPVQSFNALGGISYAF